MSRPCTVHQWSHPTEPCPDCREINSQSRHPRPDIGRQHDATIQPDVSNETRSDRLSWAILDAISGDASRVEQLFTRDVVGSGPATSVSSREELAIEFEERDGALTDVEVAFAPLDVSGAQAAVEWVASAVHAGPLDLDESRLGGPSPPGRGSAWSRLPSSKVTGSARSAATGTTSPRSGTSARRNRAEPLQVSGPACLRWWA